jgi:uncharacterized membrane protein
MEPYIALRPVHTPSAALLFGAGLGTAFFLWMAWWCGDVAASALSVPRGAG